MLPASAHSVVPPLPALLASLVRHDTKWHSPSRMHRSSGDRKAGRIGNSCNRRRKLAFASLSVPSGITSAFYIYCLDCEKCDY
ncbi:hypothetical protein HCG51_04485 [Tolypothrix sp. PCC 7910]|uniref:hypothetical protein n=1 Tax=Tolypothrix sp. PCC 7910 TaxID=2099387 RepID=UPI0014277B6E|nr:hypothetical protein [Tolypothrix sp. PCC 7910]QIR36092.1 hypothetical protein HCG51_04485 [Tolypothrix sp. PCC 7910]